MKADQNKDTVLPVGQILRFLILNLVSKGTRATHRNDYPLFVCLLVVLFGFSFIH